MIKQVRSISTSQKDKQHLEMARLRQVERSEHKQPDSYENKIVIKPWGYEFLVFENEWVAVWFLYIRKDHSTSMHCHPNKKTSLTMLSGKALCNTFRYRNFMSACDSLVINEAVFHSTKALSLDGIAVIEVETPPDKKDLVRLEDSYGRENCGYEGCSKMTSKNLDEFNFFSFNCENSNEKPFTIDNRFSISMESYKSPENFEASFNPDQDSIYCVCKGELMGWDDTIVLDVGETERGAFLSRDVRLKIDEDTILMKMTTLQTIKNEL